MEKLKYPVDTANFEKIREGGFVYADKTGYIHKLVSEGSFYFLARPRRFGKSLLLDTIEQYFKGKKHLFEGLEIFRKEPADWVSYPVVRLNLSGENYENEDSLKKSLFYNIGLVEAQFEISSDSSTPATRLHDLILNIAKKTGRKVVILIDEYDAPLTDTIDNPKLQEDFRKELHAFYSVLKKLDNHIKFCFLTGVTRYGKISIFSGLNNLNDISFDNDYAGICGITAYELKLYYDAGIREFASANDISTKEAYDSLKFHYDGYHFTGEMLDVYNPFSINLALQKGQIKPYWSESGTPTLYFSLLKEMDFNIEKLDGTEVDESQITNLSSFTKNPVPLLFQTGYLTIKSYDKNYDIYTMGYPNREVEKGIFTHILEAYTDTEKNPQVIVAQLKRALNEGQPEKFIELLTEYLSKIPSPLHKIVGRYENYCHTIIYCLLDLIGLDVDAEMATSDGYIDLLVKTRENIYIIELKVNGTAEDAIAQIESKRYGLQFAGDLRKIYKIGLGFSKTTNNISSSIVLSNP